MITSIDLGPTSLHIARCDGPAVHSLQRITVDSGDDPAAALMRAALPSPLGAVQLAINHPDILLRTAIMPPAPAERLEKLIDFEVSNLANDDAPIHYDWHTTAITGADRRILQLIAKDSLIERLTATIRELGGKLTRLTLPGIALFQAWRQQHAFAPSGDLTLVDCGRHNLTLTLIRDGELLYTRTIDGGLGAFEHDLAELRGINVDNTNDLIANLSDSAPQDIRDLIARHATRVATAIANSERFAAAQLRIDDFSATSLIVSGAGARLPGFIDTLATRSRRNTTLLNPFSGQTLPPDNDLLDRLAQLPGPWAPCLGLALTAALPLDICAHQRKRRATHWATT
ncbi:MAG: hypothetical protein ACYTF0_08815, partial [Planctomycetota bacterium]